MKLCFETKLTVNEQSRVRSTDAMACYTNCVIYSFRSCLQRRGHRRGAPAAATYFVSEIRYGAPAGPKEELYPRFSSFFFFLGRYGKISARWCRKCNERVCTYVDARPRPPGISRAVTRVTQISGSREILQVVVRQKRLRPLPVTVHR